jgi:outer membrane murein-binding lipoprotein Lpp
VKKLLCLALVTGLAACVSKSELDAAQQQNTQLQTQVAELQKRVSDLEGQLNAAGSKLAAAESELSRLPTLPLKVSFRKAMMGNGLVAVFVTTNKESFPILVSVHSKALGNTQQFRLNMRPQYPTELGHIEGASIDAGDEITVENKSYESVSLVAK